MSEQNLDNGPEAQIESPFGEINYGQTAEQLKALADQFDGITEVTNREQYDAAQKAVTALTKARTGIEARRKALKKESLEFGRLVDSTGKDLMAVVEPQEARIKALLDVVKAERAAKKAELERIEQERVDGIQARINAIMATTTAVERSSSADVLAAREALEQQVVTEADFAEFTQGAIDAKANALEALNELYQGALHDERLARQEAEQKAKEDAERKAESERLAKERAELDAIRKEQEAEAEKQRKEQAEAQAKIDAELQAERDKLAKEQAEFQAEQQRIADERRAQAEAEAEQRRQIELAAQREALKPDAEKLSSYVDQLLSVAEPVLETEQARAHMEQIQSRLSEIRALSSLIEKAA